MDTSWIAQTEEFIKAQKQYLEHVKYSAEYNQREATLHADMAESQNRMAVHIMASIEKAENDLKDYLGK